MRGSIVKDTRNADPKRPRYRVVVEERTPEGKRRRRWYTDPTTGSAFTSKKAAEEYLSQLLVSVGTGAYVPPTKETLDSWLDTWLGIMKPNLKPSTYASYERVLRVHVRPALGSLALRKITAADLDRLYASMLSGGRSDHREGEALSPRTVRYCATILGRALKDAARKGLIQRNPADLADPPRAGKVAPGAEKAWSAVDLHAFLEATADDYYGPAWAFLASTGCRRGEALGLRWSDLDLDGKRASLVQSVQKVAGQVIIGEVKTAASRRRIALDDATVDMLKAQRKRQAEQRLAVGPAWHDRDLVFTGPTGEPLHPETVTRQFASTIARLGLPKITLHGLRHTWASLALAAGIHAKVVQERLGHANVGITLNIYSHVAPVMHDDAAEQVAALVRSAKAVDRR
jgi:integrase